MSSGIGNFITGWSRTQSGIVFLLGLALLALLLWRAAPPPGPPPPATSALSFIAVAGAVPEPGLYPFDQPPTLAQALIAAGCPNPGTAAGPPLASGTRLTVAPDGSAHRDRLPAPDLLALGLALNLNTATAADLEALPGIGPALAQRIVAHRDTHGPFRHLDDLFKIHGLGEQTVAKIRPFLTLTGAIPPQEDAIYR